MVSALDAKQAIADGFHKILALVLNKFGSVLDPWVAARLTVTIAYSAYPEGFVVGAVHADNSEKRREPITLAIWSSLLARASASLFTFELLRT